MSPILFLTRPQAQSEDFAQAARARIKDLAEIRIAPLMQIIHRDLGPAPDVATIFVFTSQNAVHATAAQWSSASRVAYCVGPKTAQAAQAQGYRAIAARGTGQDLVHQILADRPEGPILHLHGAEIRVNIAQELGSRGVRAGQIVAYDQLRCTLTEEDRLLFRAKRQLLLPIFSPRSAGILSHEINGATAPIALFFLSPAVQDAWTGPAAADNFVAKQPAACEILNAIATFLTPAAP